jgi:hypothetical protein
MAGQIGGVAVSSGSGSRFCYSGKHTIYHEQYFFCYINAKLRNIHRNVATTKDEIMSAEHVLKCYPTYFEAIALRQKNFDVRRDDRGFQKGDIVVFKKFDPVTHVGPQYINDIGGTTGFASNAKSIERRIKYILTGGQFGIEPGYVVLGF